MIPTWSSEYIIWDNIESVWLDHGIFVKNKIEVTLKEKKKDRNLTRTIKVICSEYNAEYITEAIRLNIPKIHNESRS